MPSLEIAPLRGRDRVRRHSPEHVNRRIDRETARQIDVALQGGPASITARLTELDSEWSLDRALMLTFAVLGGVSHELEMRVDRRWVWLFRTQLAFLAHHAIRGWCPPVSVLRRLGYRTQQEIDAERAMLLRAAQSERTESERAAGAERTDRTSGLDRTDPIAGGL
jgi:hypothetical protein